MKILLIYPPITLHKLDASQPVKSVVIGLAYIGGVLQKASYKVRILDCLVSSQYFQQIDSNFRRYGLSDTEILEEIESFEPDVVGISCMFTSYFKDAHNIARLVKDYNKNILVIFGGAHASTFPEAVMKDNNVDITIIGEGEITICEVLDCYSNKKSFDGVKGIMHRLNGKVKKEEPRDFINNLDDIPFPAWELLENDLETINNENKKNKFLMRKPLGFILTSRGCPRECYFCSVKLIWSRRWRMRSAKNVVNEIEFLKNKYGYREFHFVDDNCSVSKQRMRQICNELMRRKLNVKLATPTGIAINTLDKEILSKMKRVGFYRLCFGIESGDASTQKIIKKMVILEEAKKVIAYANKLGFWTSATFIIGFPHETMKEIEASINFAQKSNLDFAIFYLLIPQPATEVYKIFKEQGLIDLDKYIDPNSCDWYKISITYSNGFKTSLFSNEDLQGILSMAYKKFLKYKLFSLRTYINVIRKIRSIEDLKYTFQLISIPIGMFLNMIYGKGLSNISIHRRDTSLKRIEKTLRTSEGILPV
jgi:magnesium-protoporphyrin IX monomethyl ester (oxidative) cyclase